MKLYEVQKKVWSFLAGIISYVEISIHSKQCLGITTILLIEILSGESGSKPKIPLKSFNILGKARSES